MGLDITAYRQLTRAATGEGMDPEYPEEPDYNHGFFSLWINDDFPGRADEFEHKGVYRAADSLDFRAGSYSGYNHWRDQLAALAGYPAERHAIAPSPNLHLPPHFGHDAAVWNDPKPGPFVELINFSDAEGTLGTAVCAKLAKDFADFQQQANAENDEFFREKYAEWRRAFEMASDNGCVVFH